jgi:superfamily II DNA or RNA helicase
MASRKKAAKRAAKKSAKKAAKKRPHKRAEGPARHDGPSEVRAPSALGCRLLPSGRLTVGVEFGEAAYVLSGAVARGIRAAFERGSGHGILHLAISQLETELPPSLAYWRELGRAVVGQACVSVDAQEPGELDLPELDGELLARLIVSVPPMPGAEYLDLAALRSLAAETSEALQSEAEGSSHGLERFLRRHDSVWHVLGRVCLHLAENKRDPAKPFAFLATYVHGVSAEARAQHVPLGRALEEYAGARNRKKLLALLAPLSRAAEASEFLRELVDSGSVYHPLAWTSADAYRFLRETPAFEQAGLLVRTPDWWTAKNRPRAKVAITVGEDPPSSVGLDSLLDFDVSVSIGEERLEPEEIEELLSQSRGLVLLKGKWVEVDPEQLSGVLDRWRQIEAVAGAAGMSFGQAMRLWAGAELAGEENDAAGEEELRPEWSEFVAGDWLAERIRALRSPEHGAQLDVVHGLEAELRPYQRVGLRWLWTLRELGLGGCLADDMGLGKTIQVIALMQQSRAREEPGCDLLVVPASLLENWRLEIERFAPALRVLIAHPSRLTAAELRNFDVEQLSQYDAVITSYGTAMRNEWMREQSWRHVVLDEAQAIKNPAAKQSKAVKALNASWRLALTGTPIENRLADLWSIFDFLNPGLLGNATDFGRFCKTMAKAKDGYAPLRRLVSPYILRRLKTDKSLIPELPDKTEVEAFCLLSEQQAALYQQSVEELREQLRESEEGIQRRGLILSYLMRFKQICNHPAQWLGDGDFAAERSGKFARLGEICEAISARQDKVLVFSQFREMCRPLESFLAARFGTAGLVLHGGTPVKRRQEIVRRFQEEEAAFPFLVLSLKAGGTGLNLTAASHVVHFDRWWNPAVENQATDRAFRIGQHQNVLVHKFVCRGTVEERIAELIAGKQQLAGELLAQGEEQGLTEMGDEELLALLRLDLSRSTGEH